MTAPESKIPGEPELIAVRCFRLVGRCIQAVALAVMLAAVIYYLLKSGGSAMHFRYQGF